MAAPTANLPRAESVTLANPTPPTNVPVYYQGTPPMPRPTGPHWLNEPQWLPTDPRGQFADPFNGAVAQKWPLEPPTNPLTPPTELAGKAEGDGTETTTTIGNNVGHSTCGNFTEEPNKDHPSYGADLKPPTGPTYGPELVVNGNFADATGWTLLTGATISGGALVFGNSFNSRGVRTDYSYLAGTYHISLVTLDTTVAVITVVVGDAAGVPIVGVAAPAGTYTADVVTTTPTAILNINSGSGNLGIRVDSVSVKLVT